MLDVVIGDLRIVVVEAVKLHQTRHLDGLTILLRQRRRNYTTSSHTTLRLMRLEERNIIAGYTVRLGSAYQQTGVEALY